MTYYFSSQELIDIAAAAGNVTSTESDIYEAILDGITDPITGQPKTGVDFAAWLWVKGARDVNAGLGPASNFIREYSLAQYEYRNGSAFVGDLQAISNNVAQAVAADIATNGGRMLTLQEVGETDIGAITSVTTDAGWSGMLYSQHSVRLVVLLPT